MTVTTEACSYPWEWAMVASNGEVRPCCYGQVVGSLHEAPFEAIWNNRRMLEVRHAIRTGQLHSVCRGAACTYAIAKAAQPWALDPATVRYAFGGGTIKPDNGQILVEGRVVNTGEKAWPTRDSAGAPKLRVGARLLDPDGATLAEAAAPLPVEFLFPNEAAAFSMTLPAVPWRVFVLDLVCEGEFWFADRGGTAVRVVRPAAAEAQTTSGGLSGPQGSAFNEADGIARRDAGLRGI
jgi:hypothetical protein